MAKQQNLELTGTVTHELGNSMFRVMLDQHDQEIICTISGKIRKNFIKIMTGDSVVLECSPYDLTRGRITRRYNPMGRSQQSESVNQPNIKNNKK